MIRMEISPSKEESEGWTLEDWKKLAEDFVQVFDRVRLPGEEGRKRSPCRLPKSHYIITLHTLEEPFTPPALAVTVAVPGLTPITVPSLPTMATDEFEDDQVIPLYSASDGDTVALRVTLSPSVTCAEAGDTVTDETNTGSFLHEATH